MANYPEYRNCPRQTVPPRDLTPTPSDILGPYYTPGAPDRPDGDLCDNPNLYLSGRVMDVKGNLVKDAVLDVWQADAEGVYDETGYTFRGKVRTDGGRYELNTVRPGDYKISADGQPDEFRCAHIHVKVSAEGFKPLTTQLYFADDPNNGHDPWFSERRIIAESPGRRPGTFEGRFDFVLEQA